MEQFQFINNLSRQFTFPISNTWIIIIIITVTIFFQSKQIKLFIQQPPDPRLGLTLIILKLLFLFNIT